MTSKSLREINFKISKNNFEIRNHIDHKSRDVQMVRLKFIVCPSEFTSYDVVNESSLIVPAMDLQSIVEFAEGIKEELKILFTENGKPLIASVLACDGTARIQMFVSSMLEKDLNNTRKLPATTSYKEVVNTYLESRKGCEVSLSELSESEIHRTVSPSVGTFGSNLMTSGSDLRFENTNSRKRKSNKEDLPNDCQDNDASNVIPSSFDQMKKQKLDQVANQEEQEVSQIIADLANMDNIDDLGIENLPRHTSSMNFLAGMEKFTVQRDNCDSSDCNPTQGSSRFDVSKAKFVTEDIVQASQHGVKNATTSNLRSKLKTVDENKKRPRKSSSEKLKISSTNREMKSLFATVLNTNLSLNSKFGNIQVLRSDSESDGD